MLAPHKHEFSDPDYEQHCSTIADNINDALRQGMQSASGSGEATKRKSRETATDTQVKKPRLWLGDDLDGLDTSDSDDADEPCGSQSENDEADNACGSQSKTNTALEAHVSQSENLTG